MSGITNACFLSCSSKALYHFRKRDFHSNKSTSFILNWNELLKNKQTKKNFQGAGGLITFLLTENRFPFVSSSRSLTVNPWHCTSHCAVIMTQILPQTTYPFQKFRVYCQQVDSIPLLGFWEGVYPEDKIVKGIQRDPSVLFLTMTVQHHNYSWWRCFPLLSQKPLPEHS